MDIMNIFTMIVLIAVIVADTILIVKKFDGLTEEEKYDQIRGWLLQAVLLAEKEFGSGTGRLKLSSVYEKFCKELPWIAQVIPFSLFSKYVDEALDEMKELLANNDAIKSIVAPKN